MHVFTEKPLMAFIMFESFFPVGDTCTAFGLETKTLTVCHSPQLHQQITSLDVHKHLKQI